MRWFPAVLMFLAACSGGSGGDRDDGPLTERDDGPLTVWPGEIYLGLTPDGFKFAGPMGASGGSDLTWRVVRAMNPRVQVSGAGDDGATIQALVAGADQLTVTSAEGESVTIEVLVTGYLPGSVARGEATVNSIGCRMSGCHDATGPNISSSRILGFTDAELGDWIIRGRSLRTGQTVPDHMWPIRIDEEQDVVSFLRAQPPRGTAIKL